MINENVRLFVRTFSFSHRGTRRAHQSDEAVRVGIHQSVSLCAYGIDLIHSSLTVHAASIPQSVQTIPLQIIL